jgi:ATP-dependent DNA ligase
MLATSESEIPRGEGWTYEPKWDGFRTIVAVSEDGAVRLLSRDGRPLGRYFPEIVELVAERPPGAFVADGELLVIRETGMEFDQLQLRLHPAESRVRKLSGEIPATLILFDLLREGDEDLSALPLQTRRERLAKLARRPGPA